jgi:hypothetical protein
VAAPHEVKKNSAISGESGAGDGNQTQEARHESPVPSSLSANCGWSRQPLRYRIAVSREWRNRHVGTFERNADQASDSGRQLNLLEGRCHAWKAFPLVPCPVVRAQESARAARIRREPADRIELMIAQDAARAAALHHRPHQLHGRHLLRTPIDQVADEDRLAGRMAPHAGGSAVTQICARSSTSLSCWPCMSPMMSTSIGSVMGFGPV